MIEAAKIYIDEESFEMYKKSGYKSKFLNGVEYIQDDFKINIDGVDLFKEIMLIKQPKFR